MSQQLLNLLLLVSVVATTKVEARTAVLFGASGAVGSEVLRALLRRQGSSTGTDPDPWTDVILVGRRQLPVDPSAIAEQQSTPTNITQVVVPDLAAVDRNERLLGERADACFVAIGAGNPQKLSLGEWHSVDIDMAGAAARLCGRMRARHVALLSAVDSEPDPEPFSEVELVGADADVPLGWWGMLTRYARMKGLAERAVASSGIANVRLMQPSNIVTEYTRYGWLDWTLFRALPFIDPLLPKRYHSIHVRLLGMAMVEDAVGVLRNDITQEARASGGVARLTYEDFIRIAGEKFQDQQEESQARKGKEL